MSSFLMLAGVARILMCGLTLGAASSAAQNKCESVHDVKRYTPGAFAEEDSCSTGQDDDAAEACSSISLRQLRGVKVEAVISRHDQSQGPTEAGSATGGAFCCFSGASAEDVCSSCFENAFAVEGDFYHNTTICTQSNDTCGTCGGTWCLGLPPKNNSAEEVLLQDRQIEVQTPLANASVTGSAFCCFSGASSEDVCNSCFGNAFAMQGDFYHNTTYCTLSNESCGVCGGSWCVGPPPKANDVEKEGAVQVVALVATVEDPASLDNTSSSGSAFCCFSAASMDTDELCSSCFGNAFALQGNFYHNTTYCTESNNTCGKCGGTWCLGAPPKANEAEEK